MKFGYKGRLQSKEDFKKDEEENADWVSIKYKCNRALLYDGDLPHMSTPITYLKASSSSPSNASGSTDSSTMVGNVNSSLKRVILGFNCFTEEVDECCRRAPEHSGRYVASSSLKYLILTCIIVNMLRVVNFTS